MSDLKLARELIELNGGAVDAYLDDNGKIVNDITPNTRYLVLGERPSSAIQAGMLEAYEKLYKKAVELGVETITLDQFLNRMGYTPQDRTVRLGPSATAVDFPAHSAPIGQLPETEPPQNDETSKFRTRTPYGTTRKVPY